MPEWLHQTFDGDIDLSFSVLVVREFMALALGCVVAGLYWYTHGRSGGVGGARSSERSGSQSRALMATLVLLTVLIAMMTLVIGNNVARAFSLVGALAIVRFRTVVEDTRDTAFVIFAVSVGMAIGAGFLMIPLVTIPVAGLAAFLFRPRSNMSLPRVLDFELLVSVASAQASAALAPGRLDEFVERARLAGLSTARQGAVVEHTYAVRLRSEESAPALVAALHRMPGVQSVELRLP